MHAFPGIGYHYMNPSVYVGYTGYHGYYIPGQRYVYPTYATVGASPYLTNQTYAPGDGYYYPLYYNPAAGSYFYYPGAR